MESLKHILGDERAVSFEDCVGWARNFFQENYNNQIRQLLFNFPPDQVCILITICRLILFILTSLTLIH